MKCLYHHLRIDMRFTRWLRKFALVLAIGTLLSSAASASVSIQRLTDFFQKDDTYFAEFHQVVLDEGLHLIEETVGLMWLKRPNLFRWEYFEPFAQTIVSDGKTVWVYDQELQQATVRDYSDAVGESAAQILAGIDNLEHNYTLEDLGEQGTLAWVAIYPINEEQAQFDSMRLGFDEHSLKNLEILDVLGNTTRLKLYDVILNSVLEASTFEFEVPSGVDVIDTRE